MKILSMDITNFGAISEAKLNLDDKGLVLIQGKNEDDSSQESNGAGKSTVPDALCWVLFDETAKGESGDKIVNRKAKKGTQVIVLIDDESTGDQYRISRHRKHATFKNMLRVEMLEDTGMGTTNWKDLTKGTDKLTQELVTNIVGCNHEVFVSAIYAGQEAMPDLPGMTDKQLKVLVEESAGIAQLQSANEIARKRVAEVKELVQGFIGKITTKKSNIALLEDNRTSMEDDRETWETDQEAKIKLAEDELATNTAAFDKDLGDRIVAKLQSLKQEQSDIRDKIAGSEAERDEERRLADIARKAEIAMSNADHAADTANQQAHALRKKHDHIGDTVGSACGSCGHILEAGDLVGATESSKAAVIAAVKKAQELMKTAMEATTSSVAASKAVDDYRATLTDVSALTAKLTTSSEQVTKLDGALTAWNRQKTGVEASAGRLEIAKTAVNPNIKRIDDCNSQISGIEAEMELLELGRVEQAERLAVAEHALRVFSPAGVRAHILDEVTPHLNARTSHYLATLTDGNVSAVWSTVSTTAKGELREKFVIDVESKTGGESFKSLSGGEKRKVRLACAMALQDLVASRASKPIKLFIADEIDHALDGAGLERLMSILEEKSRHKGTVLVISHSDLRDSIRNSITVVKKGGQSTIDTAGIM